MISFLGALLIRTLHMTLRVRHVHAEKIESARHYILAFWHAHLLLMLHSRHAKPIVVMSSRSRDGDIMVDTYRRFGVEAVRGSSTRGGSAALRGFIRAARDGKNIVFTPDGPKGPPRIVKNGLIFAAQATGLPIIPIAFAAKKKSYSTPGIA